MSIGFTDMTSEGKRYFQELEKLSKKSVYVGFQQGDAYEDGTTVAEVAASNEYGNSNTPARPFMHQSFMNHESELQQACDKVGNTIKSGGTAESALKELGVYLVGLVQDEILEGDFEPNSEYTIKKKGSDTPLIDTGQMRQSVQYVIREG